MKSLEGVEECREWLNSDERVSWEIDNETLDVYWLLERMFIIPTFGELWVELSRHKCKDKNISPKLIVEDLRRTVGYDGKTIDED